MGQKNVSSQMIILVVINTGRMYKHLLSLPNTHLQAFIRLIKEKNIQHNFVVVSNCPEVECFLQSKYDHSKKTITPRK
jgi:hypothetical protein